jgi:acyl dehydratase
MVASNHHATDGLEITHSVAPTHSVFGLAYLFKRLRAVATTINKAMLYLNDLQVGQRFTSQTYAIDASKIKEFAAEFDPQPFHLDERVAEESVFRGLVASGWHTAAVTMRLLADSVPLAGGLIGLGGEISWPQPTRPGDSLHVKSARRVPSRTEAFLPCGAPHSIRTRSPSIC